MIDFLRAFGLQGRKSAGDFKVGVLVVNACWYFLIEAGVCWSLLIYYLYAESHSILGNNKLGAIQSAWKTTPHSTVGGRTWQFLS